MNSVNFRDGTLSSFTNNKHLISPTKLLEKIEQNHAEKSYLQKQNWFLKNKLSKLSKGEVVT